MLARVRIRLCCGEYRIEDELQIMHWQTTRSGEIKTSRKQRHLQGSISKTLSLRNAGKIKAMNDGATF